MTSGVHNDTIAAVSTPRGEGGIAVIRISGPSAREIISRLFTGDDSRRGGLQPRCAVHGWIRENDTFLDEAVVIYFPGPRSYTGEDVIEVSCHGGTWVTRCILDAVIRAGAVPAPPGEFTRRAFLNGRMDLARAEAVADVIRAKTEASRRVAVAHLRGGLTDLLNDMRQRLIELCGLLELELDFSEEDIQLAGSEEVVRVLDASLYEIERLARSYARGRVCREGFRLVLLGSTNVGKSSLLNALISRERAIVTDVPGTTRDTIDDVLDMDGICFTITDTAGLRLTEDPVEKEGVRRSREAAAEADLVLIVLDGSRPLEHDDIQTLQAAAADTRPCAAVINKCDLPRVLRTEDVSRHFPESDVLPVSAKTQEGVPGLISYLEETALSGGLPSQEETIITHARHQDALLRAARSLRQAKETLGSGLSQEFTALDVRGAMDALGEITGAATPQDVLNHIFAGFCIGK